MNAKSWILVVAFTICTVAAVMAWCSAAATRVAETERATIVARRDAMEAALRRLEATSFEAVRQRADVEAALAAFRAKKAEMQSEAAAQAKPAPPSKPTANPADLLANDPKLQALSVAAKRARFETDYGPLLHSMRLSPAQLATLGAARAKFDELQQDMAMTMHEQKLPPTDPAIAKLRQQAEDELRGILVDVLGPAGHEQWQNYERTLPARAIVERFAGAMAVADRPMTAEQAERLTQIMAEASALRPGRDRVNITAIDWSTVDRRAAEVLSADQLSLFKRIEPIGGGASRWMAQFDRAMQEARKATATLKGGTKPPGS